MLYIAGREDRGAKDPAPENLKYASTHADTQFMRGRHRCNQIEAAHRLGVTPDALRRLVVAGALEADRVGTEWCFDVVEIERYAKSRRACGIR